MKIPFTQFLLPDGRKRQVFFDCKKELDSKVMDLINAYVSFECEMLSMGTISLTVEFETPDEETLTLAHELSDNGPEIEEAVEKLINEAHQKYKDIEMSELGNPH